MKKKNLNIKIDPKLYRAWQKYCKTMDFSMTFGIKSLIKRRLNHQNGSMGFDSK